MGTGVEVLLICLLYSQFAITTQQSSWWLSDTELFYEDPKEGPTVYNTATNEYNRKTFAKYIRQKDDSILAYSHNLNYAAEFIICPEAYRKPDSIYFTALIHDVSSEAFGHFLRCVRERIPFNADNYCKKKSVMVEVPLSYGEVLAFTWSHGSAYSFSNETATYYVPSPGEEAVRITKTDKSEIALETHHDKPAGEIIDSDISNKANVLFSPSDKYVAYYLSEPNATDNSTNKVIITTYDRFERYDYNYKMDYVKAGDETLQIHTIHIFDVETKEMRLMNVHLRDPSTGCYAFEFSWVVLYGKELLLGTWANRWQNRTELTLCDYESATCSVIYEHKYEPRQWATNADYSNIVYSNSSIFIMLPTFTGDDYWQHIWRIEIAPDDKLESISPVPSGDYEIKKILTYRADEDLVLYEAQAPNPWNRHVYAAPAGDRSIQQEDECLTCRDSSCTYQERAIVSPSDNLTISFWCTGPAPPHQKMIFVNGEELFMDDSEIRNITQPATVPENRAEWIIDRFNLSSGFEAIAHIYPGDPKLDSVPVTLHVYGGPQFNQVTDRFQSHPYPIGFKHAIVRIDVRGSGGRGWKYQSEIYGGLVTVEVEDTLEAMEMVLAKYPRLDRQRLGVYGWSFGGTMSIALVEKAPQCFFKCAIAVAPVTNFFYYNAMYTERHMGDAPFSAYTDLNANITAFRNTKFILMQGMRDDIVHFRHAALLIEQLQKNDIAFELMVYPNADHWLQHNVSSHFRHLFESFLTTCYE